jgi:hypothetical protein
MKAAGDGEKCVFPEIRRRFPTSVPLLTVSDPGSENHGVAKAQTVIRQTKEQHQT